MKTKQLMIVNKNETSNLHLSLRVKNKFVLGKKSESFIGGNMSTIAGRFAIYENIGWVDQLQGYASKFTIDGRVFYNIFPSTKHTEESCPTPAERLASDSEYLECVHGLSLEDLRHADDK